MSNIGSVTNQSSAAGAYARAEQLVVAVPVRAIDPTRRRFQLDDESVAKKSVDQSRADGDEQSGASFQQDAAVSPARSGFGLLGGLTSFFARFFGQSATAKSGAEAGAGQSDANQPVAAASMRAGIQAYARTATASALNQAGAFEVFSPSFPRLSSGRALDLTI